MKAFKVETSADALEDIVATLQWLAEESAEAPFRWYSGLLAAIESLRRNPGRCALAQENPFFRQELRQLMYGNYRVVFTIDGDTVLIARVRHSARRPYISEDSEN